MTPKTTALISWVPASKGGRNAPPIGPRFVCPVNLFARDGRGVDGNWSLVIDFIKSFGEGMFTFATVSFLVQEAPHELLTSGARFELREGRRLTATGIVSENHAEPVGINEFEMVLLHWEI